MNTQKLAEIFCQLPLPKTVCADRCATMNNYIYPRSGTNLLSVAEAKTMCDEMLKQYGAIPQPEAAKVALDAANDIRSLFEDPSGEPSFLGSVADLKVYMEAMHRLISALQTPASDGVLEDIIEAAENKEGDPSQDVIDIIVGIATRALKQSTAKDAV